MFYCIFRVVRFFLAILKAYAVIELLYVIEKKWHWKIVAFQYYNSQNYALQFCQVSLSPCAEDVIITTLIWMKSFCNICVNHDLYKVSSSIVTLSISLNAYHAVLYRLGGGYICQIMRFLKKFSSSLTATQSV